MHKLPVHPQTHALIMALLAYRDVRHPKRAASEIDRVWRVVDACLTAHPLTDPVPDFEHGRFFTGITPRASCPCEDTEADSILQPVDVGRVYICDKCSKVWRATRCADGVMRWQTTPPPAATPLPPTPA